VQALLLGSADNLAQPVDLPGHREGRQQTARAGPGDVLLALRQVVEAIRQPQP